MAITKFESYYEKICEQLAEIREANEYPTNSMAFAHWYLEKYHKCSDQQIAEAIIDGDGDKGIDAVLLDEANEALTVMQFKFPEKTDNINGEIKEAEIVTTWTGFQTLIFNEMKYTGNNPKFKEFKEQLKNSTITHFRLYFVSYNKGIIANRETIDNYANIFRSSTGSELEVFYHDRDTIANIYEKLNRKNNIKVTLKYKQMQSAYNVQDRKIDSHVGFVNGVDLVDAVSDHIATIFDENIRLYEYGSRINAGISRTAMSTDQADMFYFYNNGIVFICDKSRNSPASNEIVLEGASVVNGCQTLNVLYNAMQLGKLNSNVCVLVRIIEIDDYSERMKITEFLNSQTPIRDSYFIANHPYVRELQEKLLSNGYFLERQINEYEYMKLRGTPVSVDHVVQLEDIIQYYVGYWDNSNAALSKRGKNALFDKSKIEDILAGITAEKAITAYSTYHMISDVLTLYRKTRRNPTKQDFANYLGVTQEWLLSHIEEFRYMNTADIILMNAFANLKNKYARLDLPDLDDKTLVIDSIYIVRDIIIAEKESNTSALTKNGTVFSKVQSQISSLTGKYKMNA